MQPLPPCSDLSGVGRDADAGWLALGRTASLSAPLTEPDCEAVSAKGAQRLAWAAVPWGEAGGHRWKSVTQTC